MLRRHARRAITWLLILFGVGQFVGTFVGGKAADHSIPATSITGLAVLAGSLVAFALLADIKLATVIALVVIGAAGFGTAPALQSHVLRNARHAPTLASGANISAINVGIFIGSWLSGLLVSTVNSYRSPVWLGAGLATVALVLAAITVSRRASGVRTSRSAADTAGHDDGVELVGGNDGADPVGQNLAMTSASGRTRDQACDGNSAACPIA